MVRLTALTSHTSGLRVWFVTVFLTTTLLSVAPASAQSAPEPDDEAVLTPAEHDFVVVNLPSTLRLPLFKGNFRLTHRFAGNLRNGTFGQQASNLFGIDQGAIIGFEYRVGVARHVQAAFYRSSFDKTIQLHGKYDAIRQRTIPASVSLLVSIEGTDNFQEKYAPAIGVAISRQANPAGFYLNIHTASNPGGVARGQLARVQ